jgi:salicylate hydroxylase
MKNGAPKEIIAITGGGIAGLSAAIALRQAGFPVEIFEREASLEPIGAGIQMGPNATRIIESWNLRLEGAAFEPEAIELRSARTGALLNTIPLKPAARARYGAPYITLLRKDLQHALLNRARDLGMALRLNCAVTDAKKTAAGLEVTAGGKAFQVGALIGADGINSTVRKLAHCPTPPFSLPAVAWRGIVPISLVPPNLRSNVVLWMASGGHLVHYPVSGGSALNGVLVLDDSYKNGLDAAEVSDPRSFLLERLSGWAELARSVIAATKAWQPWRLYGVEKWEGGFGRIQTIGDAWHAMQPFLASGGVMAIEDGAALASSLSGVKIEEGLKHFRERRSQRVWQVVERSALMGRIYHCPQPFDAVRDLAIKSASATMLLERNDWLYGARI